MDPRAILRHPMVYSLFRGLVSRESERLRYAREYLRVRAGQDVLDLGCGPGDILEGLPPVQYVGFDIDETYIERARRRFGGRGQFHCAPLAEDLPVAKHAFDVVTAQGVLHHLDDDQARILFRIARRALRPGGRLVTFDGCFVPGQSMLARLFLSLDRGRYVRTEESYLTLAKSEFARVRASVHHDLLRIPYTILIMECTD